MFTRLFKNTLLYLTLNCLIVKSKLELELDLFVKQKKKKKKKKVLF